MRTVIKPHLCHMLYFESPNVCQTLLIVPRKVAFPAISSIAMWQLSKDAIRESEALLGLYRGTVVTLAAGGCDSCVAPSIKVMSSKIRPCFRDSDLRPAAVAASEIRWFCWLGWRLQSSLEALLLLFLFTSLPLGILTGCGSFTGPTWKLFILCKVSFLGGCCLASIGEWPRWESSSGEGGHISCSASSGVMTVSLWSEYQVSTTLVQQNF